MSSDCLGAILDSLSDEPLLHELHFAGGEVGLDLEATIEAIGLAVERGLPLAYIQTNGYWAREPKVSVEYFLRMKEAGLERVWVSVSPFHVEHIPFARTETCIDAAISVFGHDAVHINGAEVLPVLSRMIKDTTHTLEEFCDVAGIGMSVAEIANLYPVSLNGRACERLSHHSIPMPAVQFQWQNCAEQLLSPKHFHLDPEGNLVTGICPGISVATIQDLHPQITMEAFPVFCSFVKRGPYGLLQWALDQTVFRWDHSAAFVSRCDLCLRVRAALLRVGICPEELRPRSYYDGLV